MSADLDLDRADVVLELDAVTKTYPTAPPVTALNGATFAVHRGELVAVVGPSGSGKSTLLAMIGALDRPSSGVVRIAGRVVADRNDRQLSALRGFHIGFVFQQFHLVDGLSAIDNVATALVYRGVPARERRRRAIVALEQVGLADRAQHRPAQLSGGERQRVAIARAVVGRPELVLADEPTGNLDSGTSREILALLHALHGDGTTVIVITHDLGIASAMPRCIELRDGRVVGDTAEGLVPVAMVAQP